MEESAKRRKRSYDPLQPDGKAGRDTVQHRADGYREVLTRFQQRFRAASGCCATSGSAGATEYNVADTTGKGNFNAAANRLQGLTDHFPLFSAADDALWQLADSYSKMGDRFEERTAAALSRIVKDYPLSEWVDPAKQRLTAMNRPIPEADATALARMKYEQENSWTPGTWDKMWGIFKGSPEVRMAAKSGTPAANVFQATIPLSVPSAAGAGGSGTPGTPPAGGVSADVTVSTVGDSSALDTQPDARLSRQNQEQPQQPQPSCRRHRSPRGRRSKAPVTTSGRVLLADDSPHAQRMGERILREEGFEVVTVTDGETAIIRLKDVDPDVVIVDAFLPQVSGYDLCGYIKKQPQHSHVKVLLTSTALERVDEDQAYKAGADGQLKKPFEASVMLKSLKDLIGGSDKKKRTGTTSLSLSYNDEPSAAQPDSPAADSDADESPGEKPFALQAGSSSTIPAVTRAIRLKSHRKPRNCPKRLQWPQCD